MKENKTKKGLVIGIVITVILLVTGIILLVVNSGKEEAYRIIKVYEIEGEAVVTRKALGEIEVYNNMVLESGDEIYLKSGIMTLKLDDDKYVYVEEGTKFELIAEGSDDNSKTTINLNQGAITNDIQNKLGNDSSYEINTPNSNMAVRGTTFRVSYYVEDGVYYTRNTVFEGKVENRLKYEDGSYSDEIVIVPGGKEVIIFHDDNTTDYLTEVRDIDYSTLSEEAKNIIKNILGEESYTHTVTFMYNGSVFGTQLVESGQCAQMPTLMPEENGSWDFDFTTPIKEDVEINWR